ncbi:hypothetical protein ACSQ67_013013 [Phaseolus vulgaris]
MVVILWRCSCINGLTVVLIKIYFWQWSQVCAGYSYAMGVELMGWLDRPCPSWAMLFNFRFHLFVMPTSSVLFLLRCTGVAAKCIAIHTPVSVAWVFVSIDVLFIC